VEVGGRLRLGSMSLPHFGPCLLVSRTIGNEIFGGKHLLYFFIRVDPNIYKVSQRIALYRLHASR
jgi:hypothetical protein